MTWTIGDVIAQTFRFFARNWVTLVVGNLLAIVIGSAPLVLWAAVTLAPLYAKLAAGGTPREVVLATVAGSLALAGASSLVLWILFAPALSRIAVAAARDQRPRLADLFDFRRAGTFLGAGMLAAIAICGGTLLLIVPGIIAAIGLSLVSFFVVDEPALGALDALNASWRATRGHRLHLFGLLLVGAMANAILQTILGLSLYLTPLLVALMLVSTPLWTLALALVYLRIRPQPRSDLAALAA